MLSIQYTNVHLRSVSQLWRVGSRCVLESLDSGLFHIAFNIVKHLVTLFGEVLYKYSSSLIVINSVSTYFDLFSYLLINNIVFGISAFITVTVDRQ